MLLKQNLILKFNHKERILETLIIIIIITIIIIIIIIIIIMYISNPYVRQMYFLNQKWMHNKIII